jgi:hypothetical protein
MAEISPLRRRMIEDMTVRNLSPGDTAILHLRGRQVQPSLWSFAQSAGSRGCPRVSSASDCAAAFVVARQPDGVCPAMRIPVIVISQSV